jgi:hypothetical protein
MISAVAETAEDLESASHTTITAALMETRAETITEETAGTEEAATDAEETAEEETSAATTASTPSTTNPLFFTNYPVGKHS